MKEYLGGFHGAARKLKKTPPFRFLRCCCMIQPNEFVFLSFFLFLLPSFLENYGENFAILPPRFEIISFFHFVHEIGNETGVYSGFFSVLFINIASLNRPCHSFVQLWTSWELLKRAMWNCFPQLLQSCLFGLFLSSWALSLNSVHFSEKCGKWNLIFSPLITLDRLPWWHF